jgi:hypothetical protein
MLAPFFWLVFIPSFWYGKTWKGRPQGKNPQALIGAIPVAVAFIIAFPPICQQPIPSTMSSTLFAIAAAIYGISTSFLLTWMDPKP